MIEGDTVRVRKSVTRTVSVDELVENIKAGPDGPKVAAYFDFDGTLIQGCSSGAFHAHRARDFELGPLAEESFKDILAQDIRGWTGRSADDLMEFEEQLFTQEVAGALFHDAWRLVRAHQNRGHTVVIATSATRMQVTPIARELDVQHLLCTELEIHDGAITGRIAGRPPWGEGKLAAVREFARRQRIPLQGSHAYASGAEDVPLLDGVGFPHPVNPSPELARYANESGWAVVPMRTKRGGLHPIALARTTALYGGFATAVGAGTAVGLLTNDSRNGVDLTTSLFGRISGLLGNIDIEVVGRQHVSHRPAVFFVNHQSTLIDALVTANVVRQGFTIVAKAELRATPVLGPLLDLAGVAFVDRSSTSNAISALEPAVQKLRAGVSIAMSPEGTRSLSPRIGPFKKGGFHLAREAGVPITPIVIRNAGEIMWRNAKVAQEGTIEVVVHEPVPTAGWTRDEIDDWLPRMRQLYIDTLDDWPGTEAGHRWSAYVARSRAIGDST